MRRVRELQAVKSIGLSTVLVLNIFLFIPFTLYVGNFNEFTVSMSSILGAYLRPIIFFIAVFTLFGILLNSTAFPRYMAILAVTSILLWLQGNLMVWEYGLLDGRSIDWSKDTWRGWVDLGIWASALTFALFSGHRTGRLIIRSAVVVFSLQIALVLFMSIQSAQAFSDKPQIKHTGDSPNEIYRFSSRENVLHIIADGFQSDIFEEIVNDGKDGDRFSKALDGFVFFKENMGVFPLTHMTVPAILSGKIYKNHMPRDEFLEEAIGGKTILNEAHRSGYEVDLAVPASLAHMYTKSHSTNTYMVPANKHVTSSDYIVYDAAKLFDLALFRLLPHFLKKHVYNDQLWLTQSLLSDKKYMGLRFFSHNAFLRQLRDNMTVDREAPVYKLVHLMLSHNPMVANENCEYAGQVLPTVRETVKIQARCSLVELVLLLEKMKDLGIYDDATIILMADHGAWVSPKGLRGQAGSGPDGKYTAFMNHTIVAMALPLMAIKPPNASGPMKTSLAFSSIIDTPTTIASIIGLDAGFGGRSVFDVPIGEPRERRHYSYQYDRSEWKAEYLAPIQEFIVTGSAFDSAAWQFGDQFLPEGVIEARPHVAVIEARHE